MKFDHWWTIVYILFGVTCSSARLVLVNVLAHHMQSNPHDISTFFPRIPPIDPELIPEGMNQLTSWGKQNAVKLGVALRFRYANLISPQKKFSMQLPKNQVLFQSVDTPASIQTSQLLALGLLTENPIVDEVFYSSTDFVLKTMPSIDIDINVKPPADDTLFFAWLKCPPYMKNLHEGDAKTMLKIRETVRETKLEELSMYTGSPFQSIMHGCILYNYLRAKYYAGLSIAPFTEDIFPNGALKFLTLIGYKQMTETDRMKRLVGGTHIRYFLENLRNSIKEVEHRRLFISVGDEVTMMGLLTALQVYSYNHIPNYGSSIALEVHEIQNELFVRVMYNNDNSVTAAPIPLTIPGCPVACPLRQFQTILSSTIFQNFETDCWQGYNKDTPADNRGQFSQNRPSKKKSPNHSPPFSIYEKIERYREF
ncbi:venom acid phosphatase Acph-1-like [Diachasmimorpha longicaudata]|uniref:venom acid phosphatase Acph-1-like n=1 Tax=Diachasmimorpha longicaudata TaxID=58733 RepID=UPI0030B8BA6D